MTVEVFAISEQVFALFGGGTVEHFVHADGAAALDVICAVDAPVPGLTSWATVGACRFETEFVTADERAWRLELLAVTGSDHAAFGAAIAECGLSVPTPGPVGAGAVLPDVVGRHVPDTTTPHAFLVPPVSWIEPVPDVDGEDEVVSFLQLVPIADSELAFLRAEGLDALMELCAAAELPVADLHRVAVV